MKIIGTIGSIKKDTNKLISTTFADWSGVREGTFLKFDNDLHFYTVSRVEQRTYLKDFEVIDANVIRIQENCGVNISEQDSLNISYKEYELNTIHKFISSGVGFSLGDLVTVNGGVPSINITDDTQNSTVLKIIKVGANGEILDVTVENRGKYIIPPEGVVNIKGNGNGASAEVSYKLSDHRTFIEKDINKIEFKNSETIIYLHYNLPEGVKNGKLSVEKWEITLSANYTGESQTNKSFQVIRDFTPNYKIPLLAQNSQNQEIIFNHAITLFDAKIKNLENKNKELEEKIKNIKQS